MLKTLCQSLINIFIPSVCLLCQNEGQPNKDICQDCEIELPWLLHACQTCGQRLESTTDVLLTCGQCLRHPPPFQKVYAVCEYDQPIIHMIGAFKFHSQLVYGRLLSKLILERIKNEWYCHDSLPECIIPVPLHKERLRERGYNQALELARPLAKTLQIKLDANSCIRSRATAIQSSLAAEQRYDNVKNSFVITKPLPMKHVAILDDVITTSHTVTALSHSLIAAGVERIDVWAIARTMPKN